MINHPRRQCGRSGMFNSVAHTILEMGEAKHFKEILFVDWTWNLVAYTSQITPKVVC